MSPEGWFRVEEFAPGTFQFTEGGRWKMFLLIGDKKALLLDSGVGFGDLKALCESITSKPIDHVLTHTHWDVFVVGVATPPLRPFDGAAALAAASPALRSQHYDYLRGCKGSKRADVPAVLGP